MPLVEVRDSERPESFIRRFKRSVDKSGKLAIAKKRKFFEKPAQVRKRKKQAAVKRRQKRESKDRIPGRRS